MDGHGQRLSFIADQLPRSCRAIDLFGELIARTNTPSVLSMTTGETVTPRNILGKMGRAIREKDDLGV